MLMNALNSNRGSTAGSATGSAASSTGMSGLGSLLMLNGKFFIFIGYRFFRIGHTLTQNENFTLYLFEKLFC